MVLDFRTLGLYRILSDCRLYETIGIRCQVSGLPLATEAARLIWQETLKKRISNVEC